MAARSSPPVWSSRSTPRRALGLWGMGDRVARTPWGVLLVFDAPRRMSCAGAPGLVLVRRGADLLAAPLEAAELAQVLGPEPRPAALVAVMGGAIAATPLAEARALDPVAWIDLAAVPVASVAPLGPEPRLPALAVARPLTPQQYLGPSFELAAARDEVARALKTPPRRPGRFAQALRRLFGGRRATRPASRPVEPSPRPRRPRASVSSGASRAGSSASPCAPVSARSSAAPPRATSAICSACSIAATSTPRCATPSRSTPRRAPPGR
ncbi:MAG: bpX6 domain-containing protein [Myxococcota bacterium]